MFASASRKLIPILTTSPMKVRAVASRGRTEETVCNNAHLPYELPAPPLISLADLALFCQAHVQK